MSTLLLTLTAYLVFCELFCLPCYCCLYFSYLGPPALAGLSRWLLPDKTYKSSLQSIFISPTLPSAPSFLSSPLLASHAQGWSQAWPPITVCQGACPNGAQCQSTQELPRLKPQETLHLPFSPLFFSVPTSPRCLADDTLSFWTEMDVLSTWTESMFTLTSQSQW